MKSIKRFLKKYEEEVTFVVFYIILICAVMSITLKLAIHFITGA